MGNRSPAEGDHELGETAWAAEIGSDPVPLQLVSRQENPRWKLCEVIAFG
jgi:hypothetical protein